ncbi:MAG: hypothetical protein AB1631_04500 [Acidobacteriota bacterium]
MATTPIESTPVLRVLPDSFPRQGAVEIEIEEGVPVLRASLAVRERIEELLDKQRESKLTADEEQELDRYEEVDDYLSFLNRLSRNIIQSASPK